MAAADPAGRKADGAEALRRHAPAGQALRPVKLAAPATASSTRPGIAADRSAKAVATRQAPVTANADVSTHGSTAPRSARALTVVAVQLKDAGCRAVATQQPPTRNANAAPARQHAPAGHGARVRWSGVHGFPPWGHDRPHALHQPGQDTVGNLEAGRTLSAPTRGRASLLTTKAAVRGTMTVCLSSW